MYLSNSKKYSFFQKQERFLRFFLFCLILFVLPQKFVQLFDHALLQSQELAETYFLLELGGKFIDTKSDLLLEVSNLLNNLSEVNIPYQLIIVLYFLFEVTHSDIQVLDLVIQGLNLLAQPIHSALFFIGLVLLLFFVIFEAVFGDIAIELFFDLPNFFYLLVNLAVSLFEGFC